MFSLQVHYFSIDQEFIYEPFFADFGSALRFAWELQQGRSFNEWLRSTELGNGLEILQGAGGADRRQHSTFRQQNLMKLLTLSAY